MHHQRKRAEYVEKGNCQRNTSSVTMSLVLALVETRVFIPCTAEDKHSILAPASAGRSSQESTMGSSSGKKKTGSKANQALNGQTS